jgi:hypothetical protein
MATSLKKPSKAEVARVLRHIARASWKDAPEERKDAVRSNGHLGGRPNGDPEMEAVRQEAVAELRALPPESREQEADRIRRERLEKVKVIRAQQRGTE